MKESAILKMKAATIPSAVPSRFLTYSVFFKGETVTPIFRSLELTILLIIA